MSSTKPTYSDGYSADPSYSDGYNRRMRLFAVVEETGEPFPPCSYCTRASQTCIVRTKKSWRCSHCVRRGRRCDVARPGSAQHIRFLHEAQELKKREEENAALQNANPSVLPASATASQPATQPATQPAKSTFLQKHQRNILRRQKREMMLKGFKTLDELEEADRKEVEEVTGTWSLVVPNDFFVAPAADSPILPFGSLDTYADAAESPTFDPLDVNQWFLENSDAIGETSGYSNEFFEV